MSRATLLAEFKCETLPAYAWPGGYPLVYLTRDCAELCPACANGENGSMCCDPDCQDDEQWELIAVDVHYEGAPIQCAHCNKMVESAYGEVVHEMIPE